MCNIFSSSTDDVSYASSSSSFFKPPRDAQGRRPQADKSPGPEQRLLPNDRTSDMPPETCPLMPAPHSSKDRPSAVLPLIAASTLALVGWRLRANANLREKAALRGARDRAQGAERAWRQAFHSRHPQLSPHTLQTRAAQGSKPRPYFPTRPKDREVPQGLGSGTFADQVFPNGIDARKYKKYLEILDQGGKEALLAHVLKDQAKSQAVKSPLSKEGQTTAANSSSSSSSEVWPAQPQVIPTQLKNTEPSSNGSTASDSDATHCWKPTADGCWTRVRRASSIEPQISSVDASSPKKPQLSPKERWQRACGGGATWEAYGSKDEHAGWGQVLKNSVKVLDKQSNPVVNQKDVKSSSTPLSHHTNRWVQRRSEQAKRKAVAVDDAMYDHLDEFFLREHAPSAAAAAADKASSSSQAVTKESKPQSATRHFDHVSMDNLFLDAQLQDAAEEGREARLAREKREQAMQSGSEAAKANATDEDARLASMISGEPVEQDVLLEELAGEWFGRPDSQQQQQQPKQVDSKPTKVALEESATVIEPTESKDDIKAQSDTLAQLQITNDRVDELEFTVSRLREQVKSLEIQASALMDSLVEHDAFDDRIDELQDHIGIMDSWMDDIHRRLGMRHSWLSPQVKKTTSPGARSKHEREIEID